jgi:hypothetical protein
LCACCDKCGPISTTSSANNHPNNFPKTNCPVAAEAAEPATCPQLTHEKLPPFL